MSEQNNMKISKYIHFQFEFRKIIKSIGPKLLSGNESTMAFSPLLYIFYALYVVHGLWFVVCVCKKYLLLLLGIAVVFFSVMVCFTTMNRTACLAESFRRISSTSIIFFSHHRYVCMGALCSYIHRTRCTMPGTNGQSNQYGNDENLEKKIK